MATTELPTLEAFRVIEAFSRWGAVESLFEEDPIYPDSISKELLERITHQAYEEKNILGLIWALSGSDLDERDVELYSRPLREAVAASGSSRTRLESGIGTNMSFIGNELVSEEVRVLVLDSNYKLSSYLSPEQREALVGKLNGFTVHMLLAHGFLERTETVARRIIGALFSESVTGYSSAVATFGHGAIIDAVKDDTELAQLIRITTTSQAASARLFLHSEHLTPFHFLDLVAHFDGRQLLRFLESASGSLQSDSKFKLAADNMLKHRGGPLDETPEAELAVESRRAHSQLLSGKISVEELVKVEVAYRIYKGPYERMVKLMDKEPEAFSKAELDAELFRLVREETDLHLWARAVRADARREIEVAGLEASLGAMS